MLLQATSLFEVVPAWLPSVAVATGHGLLLIGLGHRFIAAEMRGWTGYRPWMSWVSAVALAGSVAGAAYVSIRRMELVLLFVFLVFVSGRFVQGAVTVRIVQKVLDVVFEAGTNGMSGASRTIRAKVASGLSYLRSKLADYVLLSVATGIVTIHTAVSIAAVYVIGDGTVGAALERFWIGYFWLTAIGVAFDFRYFAHRLSWTAALGMVFATTGAFLYSPVGFSSVTATLAPYLSNPLPEWMRWPLGVAGFVFGVFFWAIFYSRHRSTR